MRVISKKAEQVVGSGNATKPKIHVIDLLDRSSSMREFQKYTEAEAGINLEIETLKKDKIAEYTMTISEFDGQNGLEIDTPVFMVPIAYVEKFKGKGPRGMTPLFEAIAVTIERLLPKLAASDRVLFNIFTDGDENDSRNGWNRYGGGAERLKELMEKVKKENNFTITFIGTKVDVEQMIITTGLSRGNTFAYDGTGKGTKMSMKARVGATVNYSKSMASGMSFVDDFFEKEIDGDK